TRYTITDITVGPKEQATWRGKKVGPREKRLRLRTGSERTWW
ncbi:hypothetical protein TorRG33x02_147610, partial [Trema orientale]